MKYTRGVLVGLMKDVMGEIKSLGGHGTLEALMKALDAQLNVNLDSDSDEGGVLDGS